MAYEVGLIVGQNTEEPFKIIKVLSKEETIDRWCNQQGKKRPHDKAYQIELKCGKTYYTLNTQITKCIQRGWGWNKCKNCNGNKECAMDAPINHTLDKIPERGESVFSGEVYGDLKAIDFAFNAKRHNYWYFECTKCGAQVIRIASDIGNRNEHTDCPNCSSKQYKGPAAISQWLDEHGINYRKEVRFEDCKYKNCLPFDFGIYSSNGELTHLIEFDGEQHFKFVPIWHGDEEGFKMQQHRDAIKTNYCKTNNIPLIRISYAEFDNISNILKENLV
jgi:DNA-directed RNA polymerase subunit RPC12/RpoP